MKKKLVCLMAAGIMAGVSAATMASNAPETINLKEKFSVTGKKPAVIFPHKMHQGKLKCTDCHASDKGGPLKVKIEKTKGMSNDFHKKFCWPCHVEKKVPKGKSCSTCHKKK